MDPSLRVRQAMRIGGNAKHALERLPDVLEADVHLELMLPCSMVDSRQLLPPGMGLPKPNPTLQGGGDEG